MSEGSEEGEKPERENGDAEETDDSERTAADEETRLSDASSVSEGTERSSPRYSRPSAQSSQRMLKKEKRILRFRLPEASPSEESFSSAISASQSDIRLLTPEPEPSVLRKYILAPLRRSEPRTALFVPCISAEELELDNTNIQASISMSTTSSSRQLFEILRNSPTPSDADLNLINSTYMRKLDAMKEAIRNGADINTFRDRQTPLMIATDIADENLVRYLLSVPRVNPDFPNLFGQTPLIVATKNGANNIALLLLHHNADVNIGDNMGKTALHEALFQQRPDMVKLLLSFGADYDKSDVFGEKPMYTATVKKPNMECLRLLTDIGATPEYVNSFGTPLLTRAILNFTTYDMIEVLIEHGARVDSCDLNTGKTPLHFAASINDVTITKLLLKWGANPNLKTFYNFTPYDEAILHRSLDVATLLYPVTKNANAKSLAVLRNQMEVQP